MFYLGQVVNVATDDGDTFGIIVGEDDKDTTNKWIFCFNPSDKEYDQYGFVNKDISYVKIADKRTLSGTAIYHGPFCKYRFAGSFTDAVIESSRKEYIKEIESLNNKLKPKTKNGKRIEAG